MADVLNEAQKDQKRRDLLQKFKEVASSINTTISELSQYGIEVAVVVNQINTVGGAPLTRLDFTPKQLL